MAYLRIVRSPSMDRRRYQEVIELLDIEHRHPEGMLMHSAGDADGTWQVIEVWEGREYADQFDIELLQPAIAAAFGEPAPPREVTAYEVPYLVTP